MHKIIVFVLLMSLCSAARLRAPAHTHSRFLLRVLSGDDDTEGRYPYVIALLSTEYKIRTCSATLISPNWIVTASHCFMNLPHSVQYGNMSLTANETNTLSRILTITNSPSYRMFSDPVSGNTYYIKGDIGLAKVEPVHLRAYGNISALDYRSLPGRPVEYAGYGVTSKNNFAVIVKDQSRPLQLGEGVVVTCESHLSRQSQQFLCVAPKCSNTGQSGSQGDSGGPLFYDGKIIGVLMGGVEPSISMYTPVSPYLNWINSVISGDMD